MRHLVLLAALTSCALSFYSHAQQGSHCDLTSPPANAKKRDWLDGGELILYPEARSAQYTGCQWQWWVYSGSKVFVEYKARFEAGKLVFVRIIEPLEDPAAVTECRYRAGTLIHSKSSKGEADCPTVREMEDSLTPPKSQ